MSRIARGVVLVAGWLSLAYLAYGFAYALDRVLVRLAVFQFAGAGELFWRATPFSLLLQAPGFAPVSGGAASAAVFLAGPLVLQAVFLLWLCRAARASLQLDAARWPWLAGVAYFAGLWSVLLLAGHAAVLAFSGGGALGQMSRLLRGEAPALSVRVLTAILAAGALLLPGRLIARRLAASAAGLVPGRLTRWLAVLALAGPVVLILWGAAGSGARGFGPRGVAAFVVPGVFCLLLALDAVRSSSAPPGDAHGRAARQPGGGRIAGALAFVSMAAVVYTGLANAAALQVWIGERRLERVATEHYEILYDAGYGRARVEAFAREREAALGRLAPRLGADAQDVRIRVILYPDSVAKRLATMNDRPFSVSGTTIRAYLSETAAAGLRLDPAADAAALLEHLWPARGNGAREGVLRQWAARWLAGEWRGISSQDFGTWAARVTREEGHYTLADLLDPSVAGDLSPLVREPLGAAWVEGHVARRGPAVLRPLLTARLAGQPLESLAAALGERPEILEAAWREQTRQLAAQVRTEPPGRPRAELPFLRGMTFTHEGFGGRRGGYDSPEARAQLDRLRALGANAVAAIPYGWMTDARDRTISFTGPQTDETDEELAELRRAAHALGMKAMLKPQIWVGGGVFTGRIQFDDPQERQDWFRSYRRFLLHYARLAEFEGFDLLCIGNELGGMTPHAEEWRALIGEVRRVYRGPITYAANWGEEFESLRFWDALDYAGLNNYYPLAEAPASRAEDLAVGAGRVAAVLDASYSRWRKPILFTEVGYPSVNGGAAQPWVQSAARGVNLEEQAAGYEAVFRAFVGRPWFRGLFWWKWPSHGRGGGPRDATFTPLGKPAAEVLRAWYTRLANHAAPGAANGP
jgi:hypothetical protein